jgi:hypothetical protein
MMLVWFAPAAQPAAAPAAPKDDDFQIERF